MSEPLSLLTDRLRIRWLSVDDAEFIRQLVNDPMWLRFIGDRQVNSLDDARAYLESGPLAMYADHGFGLNRVSLKNDDQPIGICGILQRETLPRPDLGFALLADYRQQGYATEAARAVLRHAGETLGLERVLAFLTPANLASRQLLLRLGFHYEGKLPPVSNAEALDLYALAL